MFSEGQKQTIEAVLANRDARVVKQTQLMDEYPRRTIVAVKLNIPGPIKNNPSIKRLFDTGMTRMLHLFANRNIPVKVIETWDKPTGNELFFGSQCHP
ncbi:citrate lyase holo-[acyl-carrier protein] synthase [Secundilactobacillus kimchicus]|uniref:citrate lyase holo-[acyl-carrier protein] synthase n=1 Tax=Secundilactobacillus kimchicus TaxID=528209 RepID=UPI0006D17BD7|nr:citrate lyase holo-[acyl-carrier protein] synthase [Secundilactobacillus kimchicus]